MQTRSGFVGLASQYSYVAIWVAAIGVIGLLVRQLIPWLKQTNEAEANFRTTLLARVATLEQKLERQEMRHQAEQRLSNHRLRNVTACFDAILLMLEMTPDRATEVVAKIKELRQRQQAAEAQEFALLQAAYLSSTETEPLGQPDEDLQLS